MKPLLRVVLIVDTLLLLVAGILFLLTPWTALYDALQLVQTQPALVGQALGIALIGLAWLSARAVVNGALTLAVGKVVGHVIWLTSVVMLVWLLGVHEPKVNGFGQLVTGAAGVVMIVLGLACVRLANAARQREKVREAETTALQREGRYAAKAGGLAQPGIGTPGTSGMPRAVVDNPASPVAQPMNEPVLRTTPDSPSGDVTDARTEARNAARDEAAGTSQKPPL